VCAAGGDVHQNSGNNVDASNTNTATQSNNQSNSLGQTQTVDRGGCCPHPCEPQCPPEPCERQCPPEPCEPKCEPRCEPQCPPNPCVPVLTFLGRRGG
jgi:hypothetical protein